MSKILKIYTDTNTHTHTHTHTKVMKFFKNLEYYRIKFKNLEAFFK